MWTTFTRLLSNLVQRASDYGFGKLKVSQCYTRISATWSLSVSSHQTTMRSMHLRLVAKTKRLISWLLYNIQIWCTWTPRIYIHCVTKTKSTVLFWWSPISFNDEFLIRRENPTNVTWMFMTWLTHFVRMCMLVQLLTETSKEGEERSTRAALDRTLGLDFEWSRDLREEEGKEEVN